MISPKFNTWWNGRYNILSISVCCIYFTSFIYISSFLTTWCMFCLNRMIIRIPGEILLYHHAGQPPFTCVSPTFLLVTYDLSYGLQGAFWEHSRQPLARLWGEMVVCMPTGKTVFSLSQLSLCLHFSPDWSIPLPCVSSPIYLMYKHQKPGAVGR